MRVPKIFYPRNPRSRYLYLLLWLVGYLLTSAVAEETGGKLWLMDLLFVGVLMATLRAVSRTPREFMIAVLVGGLALAAALASMAFPDPHILAARAILSASFTGFLSVVILREVLQAGAVDVDKIFGAVCAYLLVGVCWAGIYSFVEQLRPGSLTLPALAAGRPTASRTELFLYFSFVTLATLGYGDILPTVATTRTLAWMEAVFGQFYIAVLVARLVGLIQLGAAGGDAGGTGGGAGGARSGKP
jgi:hypothetical protein